MTVNFTKDFKQPSLTKRELDILTLMADGLSLTEIANRLFIATQTVKFHKTHIFTKLKANSTLQAILIAWRTGLVPFEAPISTNDDLEVFINGYRYVRIRKKEDA